jgi:hypothetical protein
VSEHKYVWLLGLAITAPICALAAVVAVKYWQIALAGATLGLVVLVALVVAVIAAWPVAYVIIAVYYALRPEAPVQSTHYSMDQAREVGLRDQGSSAGAQAGDTGEGQQ